MGRKLDLSGLTTDEAEHVLKVVQRDMKLRKKEEERLSEMKQELAEEGSRCSILSRQHRFNEHCCIRCCAPFTFLINPKRRCPDCRYNVCKSCSAYSHGDKDWICSACRKSRLLRTQSLEWYYNNVKSRFKRFGSAKVLKTLYRKHIIDREALSELPECSAHEGSNDNDGSVCGSDSAFFKQNEGHSMAETLTVAVRVAEEAIEEAIAKAEEFSDSLEKQNEARYLLDHKEELIEELATAIVQKIIQRRKRSEMQTDYDFVWPQSLIQTSELTSPSQPQASYQGPQDALKTCYSLWRSRSAFSLTSDDSPEKLLEDLGSGAGGGFQLYSSLSREAKAASLPTWKSVDRLDNSSASSVLQSPDGNWMALHSSQLSRPSLLTKRKSLVFSVLEKESGVVSAYDGMGSDSEGDERSWAAALRQFRRKMSDETYYTDSQHDPEWTFTRHPPVTSPSSGQYTNTETLNSDSEASSVRSACPRKAPPNLLRRKGPADVSMHRHHQPLHQNPCPYPLPSDALDVNFNPKVMMGDSSEAEERHIDPIRRSRRRRRNKRDSSAEQRRPGDTSHTRSFYPTLQENRDLLLNTLLKRGLSEDHPVADTPPTSSPAPRFDTPTPEPGNPGVPSPASGSCQLERLASSSRGPLDEGLRSRLGHEISTWSQEEEEELKKTPADQEGGGRSDRSRSNGAQSAGSDEMTDARVTMETEETFDCQEQKRQNKRQEKESGEEGGGRRSSSCSPGVSPSSQEGALSDSQKCSAASLCSITTEVLKVLNATEELIGEAGGETFTPSESGSTCPASSSSESRRLDQRLTKMEENVYLTAGAVYGLEGALGDLEQCARGISSGTSDTELAFLEDQVATAAAQVQHSELQISNIEARISALKTAGLNVTVCNRFSKFKPKPQTLDSSRHQRRKLPAPPPKETESEQQLKVLQPQ